MNPIVLRSPNVAEGGPVHVIRVYERHGFARGGLAQAAKATRAAGRGGDEVLLHINPQEFARLKREWGEPSTNPHTGLPEYGFFSKLKKALKFETFNVKNIVKDIAKNPQRLLTGAVDPIGTKLTNKVFGTNYDPVVNQLGGATDKRFADAEAQGIDTGMAKTLHGVAGAIAGFYGGNALGNLASEGLGNVAQGLQTTANANTLSPMVPTVSGVGDYISPVVTQAGKVATPYESNLVGTLAQSGANAASKGAGALSNLDQKAIDYAKQPKNWPTLLKGIGLVGGLAGVGAPPESAPPPPSAPPDSSILQQLAFTRSRANNDRDWYTYGQGPEAQFYNDNVAPVVAPKTDPAKPVMGVKGGGPLSSRHVRGPGTGRSDSIPAQLSDGEYVLTAEDVAMLGDGSNEAGANRLDQFRQQLRKHKGSALARGKISPNAKSPMAYLKGAR